MSRFGNAPEHTADTRDPLPVILGIQQIQLPNVDVTHFSASGCDPAVGEESADQMVGIKITAELCLDAGEKLLSIIDRACGEARKELTLK